MAIPVIVAAFGLDILRKILFMKPKNYVARAKGKPVDLTKKPPPKPSEKSQ